MPVDLKDLFENESDYPVRDKTKCRNNRFRSEEKAKEFITSRNPDAKWVYYYCELCKAWHYRKEAEQFYFGD